jgi:hypothetical protein
MCRHGNSGIPPALSFNDFFEIIFGDFSFAYFEQRANNSANHGAKETVSGDAEYVLL